MDLQSLKDKFMGPNGDFGTNLKFPFWSEKFGSNCKGVLWKLVGIFGIIKIIFNDQSELFKRTMEDYVANKMK